jgi:hypothetical protein
MIHSNIIVSTLLIGSKKSLPCTNGTEFFLNKVDHETFKPLYGAFYFCAPENKMRITKNILTEFLEQQDDNHVFKYNYDFDAQSVTWCCSYTFDFSTVKFNVSMYSDTIKSRLVTKFHRSDGDAKRFGEVVESFRRFKDVSSSMEKICPKTLETSPITFTSPRPGFSANKLTLLPTSTIKEIDFKNLQDIFSVYKIKATEKVFPRSSPLPAKTFVSDCERLREWSFCDPMEALQAIRLALPWKWTDYFNAYHALHECNRNTTVSFSVRDVETMLNGIISIYKVLEF